MSLNKVYQRTKQQWKGKTKERRELDERKLFPWVRPSQKSSILYLVSLGVDGAEHNWIPLFFQSSWTTEAEDMSWLGRQTPAMHSHVSTESTASSKAPPWIYAKFKIWKRPHILPLGTEQLIGAPKLFLRGEDSPLLVTKSDISWPEHLVCPGHGHLHLSVLFLPMSLLPTVTCYS